MGLLVSLHPWSLCPPVVSAQTGPLEPSRFPLSHSCQLLALVLATGCLAAGTWSRDPLPTAAGLGLGLGLGTPPQTGSRPSLHPGLTSSALCPLATGPLHVPDKLPFPEPQPSQVRPSFHSPITLELPSRQQKFPFKRVLGRSSSSLAQHGAKNIAYPQ